MVILHKLYQCINIKYILHTCVIEFRKNIGATVSTWKEILNDGHLMVKDTEGIMRYHEDEYGPQTRFIRLVLSSS